MMMVFSEKTQAIRFCKAPQISLRIGGNVLSTTQANKFLGVWFDRKLKFNSHAEQTLEKPY